MNNNDRFKNPSVQSTNLKSINVNSKKKNTFNKRAFIISMSSMLGAGVVGGVVVIVPIALTTNLFKTNSSTNKPVLERITTIYDLQNYTANLFIAGENLATSKEEYIVHNVTNANTRTKVKINSDHITINLLPNNEINLAVYDSSLISTSKYEVSLTNAEPIVSNPNDNKLQPSFSIVTQPQNQIIGDSSVNSVDFSISVSAVSNGISGETLFYKWYISDDASNWSLLPNSNASNYRYDISGLTTKKYFKCEVSYKYAPTISSTVVYVERNTQPVISISTQPQNHTIAHDAETPTLTVAASIINTNIQELRYQWYSSNSPDSGFTRINNATSSTYKVDNATTTKKYYKCEISSENANTISSNVVYVERSQGPVTPSTPTLSFRTHPTSVILPHAQTSTTLTVAVDVTNPTSGVQPSYKWYISDNETSGWTPINNATQASYTYDVSSLAHSVKKYFKCEVNYDRATAITSNVVYVERTQPPVVPPPIQSTPILSFRTQLASVTVPYAQTTTKLTVAVNVANPISGVQPSYKWYISDNGNSGWTLIANTNKGAHTYDLSSLAHSVKKYFKCEVNYDYATPITSNVAYVKRAVPITGPTPEEIHAAITKWNSKDPDVKTNEFNSLMANPTNNEIIKKYILKQGGMAHFFSANTIPAAENATQHYRDAQKGMSDAFLKYNIDNIAEKPIFANDGNNFMSLKGVFDSAQTVLPNTTTDNINADSMYLFHNISSLGTYVKEYNFYSIAKGSYDIEIQSDFTLKIFNFKAQSNFIIGGRAMNDEPFYLRYNFEILMTNATLFPGLTDFVKTTLLKLEK